jgi:hypothetical protein
MFPVSGTWTHDYLIGGMGFQMILSTNVTLSGSGVSGTGTWSGEACCSGTVTVTGTVIDGLVRLDITQRATAGILVPAIMSHFEGRANLNTLTGILTGDPLNPQLTGNGEPYSYRRVQ